MLVVLSIVSYNLLESEFYWREFFILLGFYLMLGLWIYITLGKINIFYDSEYMYLKSRKNMEIIPLKNIYRLKLTLSDMAILGMQYSEYRIEYIDNDNESSEVSFWVSTISARIDDFESTLKKVNVNVKAEHWAHSFE